MSTTITTETDLVFFRPTLAARLQAIVAQSDKANVLDVVLPVTTQAVGRGIGTGSYLHSADPIAATIARDVNGVATVTTVGPHGLQVGAHLFVDNASTSPDASGLDPNQWTEFSNTMHEARQQHTTTLLSDGRIVVTGGISATGAVIDSVELFDPATGAWTQGPKMVTARYDHGATLLQDGRVLISGGTTQAGASLTSCEMYDPVANTWATAPVLPAARAAHVTMLLANASVLAVGGNEGVTTYAIYQPWTNTWASTSSGHTFGEYATATLLLDLRVLVAGGRVGGVGVTSAYVYDHGNRSWTATSNSLPTGVFSHTATALPNGKVLVAGGTTNGTAGVISCSIFDPATNTWSAAASLKNARFAHRALLLSNGTVLVLGGQHSGTVLASVEIYNPTSNTWSASTDVGPTVGPLNQARAYAGAVYTNRVLVVGGIGTTTRLGDVERFPRETGGGGLNGFQVVSTYLSPTEFQYLTPDFPFLSACSASITPYAAPGAGDVPGPYIYDPASGLAVTGTATKSAQSVPKGSRIRSLAVVDATQFPDESGYLVLGFGTSVQQAPVRYLGRMSSTALLIDQAYLFTQDLVSGADVTLLSQKGPFVPDNPEQVGSLYATDSSAGRVAAVKAIEGAAAAGVKLNIEITYPLDVGLGGEGWGTAGPKVSDKVWVWDGETDASEAACSTTAAGPATPGVQTVPAGPPPLSCDLATKPSVPPPWSNPGGVQVSFSTVGPVLCADGTVPWPSGPGFIPTGTWYIAIDGEPGGLAVYDPTGITYTYSDGLNPGGWFLVCPTGMAPLAGACGIPG